MNQRLFKRTDQLKASVLVGVSLFLSASSLFIAIYHLAYCGDYITAFLELIFSVCSGIIYTLLKQGKNSKKSDSYYAWFFIIILLLVTAMRPLNEGFFVWVCSAPLALYLLLGVSKGFIASGVLLSLNTIIIIVKSVDNPSLPIAILVNLTLCYVGIWLIFHLYESNRFKVENSLIHLASRDSLTGSFNRMALTSTFNHQIANIHSDTNFSLLILDIDYFKQVNDQYGHDIGDKVLIETTQLLSEAVGDENLFRIGGEEFCITLLNHDIHQAQKVGEVLRNKIANRLFDFGDKSVHLTLSIGICQYNQGKKLNDMLKFADIELYKAKRNGRNQVCICICEPSKTPADLIDSKNQSACSSSSNTTL
jgi:diguanylate cyclase